MARNASSEDLEKSSIAEDPDYQEVRRLLRAQRPDRQEAFLRMLIEEEGESEFYTVEEFARKTRVSAQTVRRWLKKGRIKATKIALKWLIRRTELEALGHER